MHSRQSTFGSSCNFISIRERVEIFSLSLFLVKSAALKICAEISGRMDGEIYPRGENDKSYCYFNLVGNKGRRIVDSCCILLTISCPVYFLCLFFDCVFQFLKRKGIPLDTIISS